MNEDDTCRTYILPKLKSAGWEDENIIEQLDLTPGRIVPIGDRYTRREGLRPDYVLFIRQNIPIAVVEAKAEYTHPGKGLPPLDWQSKIVSVMAKVNAVWDYRSASGEELRPIFGRTLMPSILDKAFKGEL